MAGAYMATRNYTSFENSGGVGPSREKEKRKSLVEVDSRSGERLENIRDRTVE